MVHRPGMERFFQIEELVGHLFELCVEKEPWSNLQNSDNHTSNDYTSNNLNYTSNSDPLKAPVVLTHVCRSWRRFAIQNPTLWSYLTIGCRRAPRTPHRLEKDYDILDTFLTRAASCPVAVRDGYNRMNEQRCEKVAITLFEILSRHSSHLGSLEIDLLAKPAVLFFELLSSKEWPNLRTISMTSPVPVTLTRARIRPMAFVTKGFPALTCLSLSDSNSTLR